MKKNSSDVLWFSLAKEKCFELLKVESDGLLDYEAGERLKKYGVNKLKENKHKSVLSILFEQFNNFLIYILIFAAVISFALDEVVDGTVIMIILVLIGVIGFFQEYRAEKAIEALKKMASLRSKVIRNGNLVLIDAEKIVPGDILMIETGDKVPADARIIENYNLATHEATLTGESLPVKKEDEILSDTTVIGDRINMVFSGAIVTAGRAKVLVVKTGMNSELGKIARLIQSTKEEPSPLQKKLGRMGKYIGGIVILISLVVLLGGVLKGIALFEMFKMAVSLAVAAVPEGLPAVVIVSLAIGAKKMVKRGVLMRKLPTVENLGETNVICSDKTGTLTCNQMTVKKIFVNNRIIDVTGTGYGEEGDFIYNDKKYASIELEKLLTIGALNNNAKLKDGKVIGDPTEGALIVSASKFGFDSEKLNQEMERVDEMEFTSERKMMTTVHSVNNDKIAYTKGAPEMLLEKCSLILDQGQIRKLDKKEKQEIAKVNEQLASSAMRVLGFAYKNVDSRVTENDLVFVGLQAMIDPPREEVKVAIEKAKMAGIRVIMITGDHAITAKAIADELGIEGDFLTGHDLEKMDSLEDVIGKVSIYARVHPEHKIKIVEALQKQGHVVAMTGDGVNDAPALKRANIGIAMGITGTDVSKEASDMVLTDDNFASIVNAIEEGRGIYNNIRKFVQYLLSSNLGEVLTVFFAIMFIATSEGEALIPIVAIQILWINLVTDGLPALALSIEPFSKDIMKWKPRKSAEHIINRSMTVRMILIGVVMMLGTLFVFKMYNPEVDLIYAQTMAFTTLMFFQMFNVFNCRSHKYSVFSIGFFKNKFLLLAILISIILQVLVIHTPLGQYFGTTSMSLIDWVVAIAVASSVLIVVEVYKILTSLKSKVPRTTTYCIGEFGASKSQGLK